MLTVSGNAGDILLTVAADPQAGFAAAPGSTIPANQIQVQHTQGSGSNLAVPVKVTFDSPLVVSANQNNALDLEFDLAHPAFLVGHVPAGTAASILVPHSTNRRITIRCTTLRGSCCVIRTAT